jgi:hypothetical protein
MEYVGLGRLMVVLVCAGCAAGADAAGASYDASAGAAPERDRDSDGLCDETELMLGTDPERPDTDGDGLLDVHEQIGGTDPRNRQSPGVDQLVLLPAGERVDFRIGLAVDQSGAGVRGEFSDRNALDREGRRAGDFFRSSSASAAVPPENARTIESGRARFASVLGRTRLEFELHFAADAAAISDCAAVLPFDYAATLDDGTALVKERALLIVAKDETPPAAADFCLPVACL